MFPPNTPFSCSTCLPWPMVIPVILSKPFMSIVEGKKHSCCHTPTGPTLPIFREHVQYTRVEQSPRSPFSECIYRIQFQTTQSLSASRIGSVYPKVKVREQEEFDDQYDFETKSLQSMRTPESFSLNDFSSPDNSPTSVVRVLRFDSSTSGAINNRKQKILDENRRNIRASPVLRPRAVLSSPDNDQMIGSKNKTKGELLTSTKKQSPRQNRHAQCNVIPRPVAAGGSVNTRRELKEVADCKGDHQSRQRTVINDPSPRANLQKGKP